MFIVKFLAYLCDLGKLKSRLVIWATKNWKLKKQRPVVQKSYTVKWAISSLY
jgi:hypothetical protein